MILKFDDGSNIKINKKSYKVNCQYVTDEADVFYSLVLKTMTKNNIKLTKNNIIQVMTIIYSERI